MKIKGSKLGSIIGSTLVAIFSLTAAFSGSIAWFNATRNSTVSADEFKITNNGLNAVSAVEFYPYSKTLSESNTGYYVFGDRKGRVDINGNTAEYIIEGGSGEFDMEQYKTNDPHQPVLMLLHLKSGTEKANIRAMTNSVYMASNGGSIKAYNEAQKNPLSSVIEFRIFDNTEISTVSSHYAITNSRYENSDQESFARFYSNGDYKEFSNDISLFNKSASGLTSIGIVIDYNSTSLEYIYSYYLGHTALNNANGLRFGWDWELSL